MKHSPRRRGDFINGKIRLSRSPCVLSDTSLARRPNAGVMSPSLSSCIYAIQLRFHAC